MYARAVATHTFLLPQHSQPKCLLLLDPARAVQPNVQVLWFPCTSATCMCQLHTRTLLQLNSYAQLLLPALQSSWCFTLYAMQVCSGYKLSHDSASPGLRTASGFMPRPKRC
jgi:hypothetical protein